MSARTVTKKSVNFLVGWGIAGTSHFVFRSLRVANETPALETLNKVGGLAAAVAVGMKCDDIMRPYTDQKVDALFDYFEGKSS